MHCNTEWWRFEQAVQEQSNSDQRLGKWRHPTRGRRSTPWEAPLLSCWGASWRGAIGKTGAARSRRREDFVAHCSAKYKFRILKKDKMEKFEAVKEDAGALALPDPDPGDRLEWGLSIGRPRFEIVGDSMIVTNWANGDARMQNEADKLGMYKTLEMLYRAVASGMLALRSRLALLARHVPRRFNTRADTMANEALAAGELLQRGPAYDLLSPGVLAVAGDTSFRLMYDGASRGNPGQAATGWCILASRGGGRWEVAISGGKAMGVATSMAAELQAFIEVSHVFLNCLNGVVV